MGATVELISLLLVILGLFSDVHTVDKDDGFYNQLNTDLFFFQSNLRGEEDGSQVKILSPNPEEVYLRSESYNEPKTPYKQDTGEKLNEETLGELKSEHNKRTDNTGGMREIRGGGKENKEDRMRGIRGKWNRKVGQRGEDWDRRRDDWNRESGHERERIYERERENFDSRDERTDGRYESRDRYPYGRRGIINP